LSADDRPELPRDAGRLAPTIGLARTQLGHVHHRGPPGLLECTNYFVDIRINSYDSRRMALQSLSKPPDAPLPTDAELAILAVLWRHGASTVREVHDALGKDSGYTSTLKLLQLMFEKGLVVRTARSRSHLYEARVPKEQTQRQIAGDLLKRAFDGSAKSLVLGALAAQPASAKDLVEIRSLLDEVEQRRGKKRSRYCTSHGPSVWAGRFCIFCGKEFWSQPSMRSPVLWPV